MKYKCVPKNQFGYSPQISTTYNNMILQNEPVIYPIHSFGKIHGTPFNLKTYKSFSNCGLSNNIYRNDSYTNMTLDKLGRPNVLNNHRYRQLISNHQKINLSALWASKHSDILLPKRYTEQLYDGQYFKVNVLSKTVHKRSKGSKDIRKKSTLSKLTNEVNKSIKKRPPTISQNQLSRQTSLQTESPLHIETPPQIPIPPAPQLSLSNKLPLAPSLPQMSMIPSPPDLPASGSLYDSLSKLLNAPRSGKSDDDKYLDDIVKPGLLKNVLKEEDKEKVTKYQSVMGELKAMITKSTYSRNRDNYILPSNIVGKTNRIIPPIIPPSPEFKEIKQPAKYQLRHVTPPHSPRVGKVLAEENQLYKEGLNANERIRSASVRNEYQYLKNVRETQYLNAYEKQIIDFLPLNIPEDKTKFVADDGTEWDVIIVKESDNIDDKLKKITQSADEQDVVSLENREIDNIQSKQQFVI